MRRSKSGYLRKYRSWRGRRSWISFWQTKTLIISKFCGNLRSTIQLLRSCWKGHRPLCNQKLIGFQNKLIWKCQLTSNQRLAVKSQSHKMTPMLRLYPKLPKTRGRWRSNRTVFRKFLSTSPMRIRTNKVLLQIASKKIYLTKTELVFNPSLTLSLQ